MLSGKVSKPTKIFEFILDILSEPRYRSIIAWEGKHGQFTIIQPDLVAHLWGERNGRKNMTYQKFTRALRYYYHKNVLAKVRGRKYTYKFNFRELEMQYGYQGMTISRATTESTGNNSYGIAAIGDRRYYHSFNDYNFSAIDVGFPTSSPVMFMVPHERKNVLSPPYANGHYCPYLQF